MEMKQWDVIIVPPAKEDMRKIKDWRIQEKFSTAIKRLEYAPDKQGKPLGEKLVGFHSIRAASQRYRIIYHIRKDLMTIFVVGVGIRRAGDKQDVYAQTERLLLYGVFDLNIEIEKVINAKAEKSSVVEQMSITPEQCLLSESENTLISLQEPAPSSPSASENIEK